MQSTALSHHLHKELHQKVSCGGNAPRYTKVTLWTSQILPLKELYKITLGT